MTLFPFKNKAAAAAIAVAALLALALAGSWVWFLRAAPQPGLSQDQLNALAAQAGKQGGQLRREADPYRDEALRNTIRKHAAEIQKPWLTYLAGKPDTTEGAVTLAWQIDPDGKVSHIQVAHSDFDNPAFNEGVRDAVAQIAFPAPPGGQPYEATHKLRFKQDKDAK